MFSLRRAFLRFAFGLPLFAASTLALAPAATHAQTMSADIVDTAVEAGNFTTLSRALTTAGLVDTLKGPGPFTVFAPTDAAFARLPTGTLDALLADPDTLRLVLTYHVIAGEVTAADAATLETATTVEGEDVTIGATGGDVQVDNARVIQPDVVASNGIIHVIDTVMLPPSFVAQTAGE